LTREEENMEFDLDTSIEKKLAFFNMLSLKQFNDKEENKRNISVGL
jgi:hypothetical protein